MPDKIVIKGAREHNLKNIDLTIPRDKFVVFTGISGSGKSSIAFDTIYAEGQRRYVESLSSYARQFLGQMEKPDLDSIDGLSPAISIDQKTTSRNPRSTVGTVTEIYDYMRLLWARIGIPHCPKCGKEIRQQTSDQIVDQLIGLGEGTRLSVMAPVVRGRKGEHAKVFEDAIKSGYVRVRVDGTIYDLSDDIKLAKTKKHDIEIIIDRIIIRGKDTRTRLTDSVEVAAKLSGGIVMADVIDRGVMTFSQNYACEDCGISIEELAPRSFSFNNPYGACPECMGLGTHLEVDADLVVARPDLSLNGGAIRINGMNYDDPENTRMRMLAALAEKYEFSMDTPFNKLPKNIQDIILYGDKDGKITVHYPHIRRPITQTYEGIIENLNRRYRETDSDNVKTALEEWMSPVPCDICGGKRLKKEILAVTVCGANIDDFANKTVSDALAFIESMNLAEREQLIANNILKEIRARLGFLESVGLEYLTMARSAESLSGGESQRIRLATQIGSSLMGVLYILDEPSIGLHQRDNQKLLNTLKELRDKGNTLIVVEHDEDTMYAADYIVDVGPGAGIHGGNIVCAGTVEDIKACRGSVTGDYLSGRKYIEVPKKRRAGNGHTLTIKGARENNLKGIDVSIPLGTFTCITGVSGSGKSSLVNEILFKRLSADLNGSRKRAGAHDGVEGEEWLDKIINIDQSPIGRSPRSNPATYTGVFNDIRTLFAKSQDAKMRGYGPGRFSFNIKGGRCEACAGDGLKKIEMHFLPDIYVPCEVCHGMRYNRETLEVRYKDKNIYDVLNMTVEEAIDYFDNIPSIRHKIQTLADVGLGYIKLGQPSTTLSGGEAQRIKLATELARRSTGKTIYVLDEPTTGLHTADVHKLIEVLNALVDVGNSVVVIEHNLDVIKTADHIIDLGPEGGNKGGCIVAAGTPEEVALCDASYTGQFLRDYLNRKYDAIDE